MRAENILDAMQNIDIRLILEADPTVKRRINWVKWCSLAACFCLIASIVGFYATLVFGGADSADPGEKDPQAPAPPSKAYQSVFDMYDDIGKEILYTDDMLDESASITLVFNAIDGDKPHHLNISSSKCDYYIFFGNDSVDDSRIAGYVEQGLRFELNGVTVHYSEYFSSNTYRSQAKFVYDGDLYVIDNTSSADNFDIVAEVTKILGGTE